MFPRRLILLASLLGALMAAAPAQAIVGGTPTAPSAANYPWQVAVLSTPGEEDDETWFCGGTLVGDQMVLTAAHCVIDDAGRIIPPGHVKVLSGHTDRHLTTFTQVDDVALHPDLDMQATPSGMPSGDLALLRLTAVAPGAPLGVVGEEEGDLWEPGDVLRITGWGLTSASSTQIVDVLRWANVPRLADGVCASAYGADFLPTTMLCASAPGVDTCAGDSGGPIAVRLVPAGQLDNPTVWRLVGVTSWGSGCGDVDFPGVYARLGEAPMRAFATDPEPTWSPVNVVPPSMPATADVGDVVTCTPGTWTGEVLALTYEFHRLASNGSTTIVQSGPSNVYVVTAQDAAGIVCVELVANDGGTAWEQSQATSVIAPATTPTVEPGGVPTSQVPADGTPRAPVSDEVTGQVVATAADAASPRASRARARCAGRRCTVSVRVTDPAPSSGIRRVTGTLRWTQACRRDGRAARCARSRRIAGRKASGSTWTLRTPRLPRGSASISIVAVDKAGRIQSTPARLRFRVR